MRKRLGTVRDVAEGYNLSGYVSHALMMMSGRVSFEDPVWVLSSVWDVPIFANDSMGTKLSRLFGLGALYPDELSTHGIELNAALLEEDVSMRAALRSRLACEITSYVVATGYSGARRTGGWEWQRLVRSFGIKPDKLPELKGYLSAYQDKWSEELLAAF